MENLAPDYLQRIEDIKAAIQESEELSTYLESEEADDYVALKEVFEPDVAELYREVAHNAPLQILSLEKALLDEGLEGMFLPKILGYAILRPLLTDEYQYIRPQDHLKEVLLAIASNGAFSELQRRIGQALSLALSLSTNIWVSSLINEVKNKTPRVFFYQNHDTSIRTPKQRMMLYNRYKRQFLNDNYNSAVFPTTASEMATDASALENFLRYRFGNTEFNNETLVAPLIDLFNNEDLKSSTSYQKFTTLIGLFVDFPDSEENALRKYFRSTEGDVAFEETYFEYLHELHQDLSIALTPENDKRMMMRVGTSGEGALSKYYVVANTIHTKGIDNLETQDAIRVFISGFEGLSPATGCVRWIILRYFHTLMSNLGVGEYSQFFEITKLFNVYFGIFINESFVQEVRQYCMKYLKKLMKRYTDKRGRDYQDIKKFVQANFVELGFMTQKESVNYFKTKRVRKPAGA